MESISNINNSLNRLEPKPKERTTDVELSQDILDLIDNKLFINRYRWLKKEYDFWGIIFASLWVNPQPYFEPVIYKIIHSTERHWQAFR